MKKNIHPKYQKVLFIDSTTGHKYLCGTTLKNSEEKEMFEGQEYPVCRVSISSLSHPFFVGGRQLLDTEGRVAKFQKKYMKPQESATAEEVQKEEQEDAKKQAATKTKKKA